MIIFCIKTLLLFSVLANKKNLFKPNKAYTSDVSTCAAASEVTVTDPFGEEQYIYLTLQDS